MFFHLLDTNAPAFSGIFHLTKGVASFNRGVSAPFDDFEILTDNYKRTWKMLKALANKSHINGIPSVLVEVENEMDGKFIYVINIHNGKIHNDEMKYAQIRFFCNRSGYRELDTYFNRFGIKVEWDKSETDR